MSTTSSTQTVVQSYLFLRKGVGITAIALPFTLVIGKMLLQGPGVLDSMSGYYYSVMRNVFVGCLFAIAIFLICYRYDLLDTIVSSIAGICAIGVALFPTTPEGNVTQQQVFAGWMHLAFATSFFIILAVFAIVLFRKTDPNQEPTLRKLQRNTVYLYCGIIILACIGFTALFLLFPLLSVNRWLQSIHPILWFEAIAVLAFGIAWFVKGETILKDN